MNHARQPNPTRHHLTRHGRRANRHRNRRGVILILVALLLIVFLAAAAFSVDVAYMQLTQTQLRAATDAAARAGGEIYARTNDIDAARDAAISTAGRNLVAGQPLQLGSGDIQFGTFSRASDGSVVFTVNEDSVSSVRVLGRRTTDSLSGRVQLFFGGALGVGHFEPVKTATVVYGGARDVCLVADRSHSMAFDMSGANWSYPDDGIHFSGECYPPHPTLSRWAAVREAIQTFLDTAEATAGGQQIGLASYSSRNIGCDGLWHEASSVDQQLTTDYSLIENPLNAISASPIPGGTNIYAGIIDGISILTNEAHADPSSAKTMILLTDGVATHGSDPMIAAQQAAAADIEIITVTFSNGADQTTMQAIANATGGKHYHAPTASALMSIFREIALSAPLSFAE